MKGVNKLTIVLISIIVFLLIVLGYGVYTGFKVKAEIISLELQIEQLTAEKNDLNYELSSLQEEYSLLEQDVAKIYKTCLRENACKGHFPNVSWYCNNVGDEVDNPSHICVCDVKCDLNATEIVQ